MQMLYDSWQEKERKTLSQPHFLKEAEDAEPPELTSFFKNFSTFTIAQKAERWQAIKQEQKNNLATWKMVDKAIRAQGDLGR